jgi:hypothetical protein
VFLDPGASASAGALFVVRSAADKKGGVGSDG